MCSFSSDTLCMRENFFRYLTENKIMARTALNYEISLDIAEYDVAVDRREIEDEKALVNAAIHGEYENIEKFLKSGVCVDAKEFNKLLFYASKNYLTPLQVATLYGHDNCVQLLIDHGADVNAKDLFDVTALHLAAYRGSYGTVKALLHAKADTNVPMKFSYCVPLRYSANKGQCAIVPHLGGTTPLHLAAATNSVDCVKELIRYGADFNAVDEYGRTSLYIAAQFGYSDCVLTHLKEAVGRDILSLPSFKTSDTPLHFAVKYHMVDCVKELLYLGSDVNHRNFDGLSPLHTALLPSNSKMPDQMEVLKLLIIDGYNSDINQPDWEGFTPLHYVCFNGHRNMWHRRPEMARLLIGYGANVNIKDYHKISLLEQELKYPEEDFVILKCLVRSLLHLPRLASLNIGSHSDSYFSSQVSVADNINYVERLSQDLMRIPLQYQERLEPIPLGPIPVLQPDEEIDFDALVPRPAPRARFYAGYSSSLVNLHNLIYGLTLSENQNVVPENASEVSSLILKKQLWYEEIASSPRTLQHHCRFLVRKILGPMKLKHIKKLPIPKILQSYLLLELDK